MKKTNRKKLLIIFGCILAVLCVVLITIMFRDGEVEKASESDLNIVIDESEKDESEKDNKELEENNSNPENNANNAEGNENQEQTYLEEKPSVLAYIPGTELYIEAFAPYDGVYIENGEDKEIKGVTTMILSNKSDENIEYVEIEVKRNGKQLNFNASTIPVGATVLIQEANEMTYEEGEYTDLKASIATIESLDKSAKSIKVEDNGDDSLTVTNLTNKEIPCTRIFYKLYMEQEKMYVGGITYTAKIESLGPKESIIVSPLHYISDFAKIMMVRTYDTVE